jgi:hypothetical protein
MRHLRERLRDILARHAPLIAAALLAGALAFGGLLRLGAARISGGPGQFWQGEWEYYGIGAQLAEAGQFRAYPGWVPTAFRMPLYPSFIALTRRAVPGIGALRLAQALWDWCAIAGVYICAAALGGGLCGGLAACLYALWDLPLAQVPLPQIECFFGGLVIFSVCLWVLGARRAGGRRAALLGTAMLGLTLSCRATFLALPFFLALTYPADGWKQRGRRLAGMVLGSYLLLTPWLLRNAVVFHRCIAVESGAASLNFWGASVGMVENPQMSRLLVSSPHRGFLASAQRASDRERPRLFWRESWRNIRLRPLSYLAGFWRRLPVLWSEQWLFLLLALPLLGRRPLPAGARVIVLVLAYFSVHAFMGVTPRYARPAAARASRAPALAPGPARGRPGRAGRRLPERLRAAAERGLVLAGAARPPARGIPRRSQALCGSPGRQRGRRRLGLPRADAGGRARILRASAPRTIFRRVPREPGPAQGHDRRPQRRRARPAPAPGRDGVPGTAPAASRVGIPARTVLTQRSASRRRSSGR